MKYKIETHFGCTSNTIIVNDKAYYGEDSRYSLTDDERKEFDNALLLKFKEMFDNGEVGVYELLQHFDIDRREYSENCETCGDSVESVYYEEF